MNTRVIEVSVKAFRANIAHYLTMLERKEAGGILLKKRGKTLAMVIASAWDKGDGLGRNDH